MEPDDVGRLWVDSSPGFFNVTRQSLIYFAFCFFSSRSRHTILQGDWSSDVCSSDLSSPHTNSSSCSTEITPECWTTKNAIRSEERRVGKEGRTRWSPDPLKKKNKKWSQPSLCYTQHYRRAPAARHGQTP